MDLCRLCQVQVGTLSFIENQDFIQKVAECTNIQIDDDKNSLPQKVCAACKLSIEEFYVFLLNVRLVNKKLQRYISNPVLQNKKINKTDKTTKVRIKCSVCTKTFAKARSLEIHKKVHHSKLDCAKCNLKFEDLAGAQSHVCVEEKFSEVSSFDEKLQDSNWHCFKCNLKFEDSTSGKNHECLEDPLMVKNNVDDEEAAGNVKMEPSYVAEYESDSDSTDNENARKKKRTDIIWVKESTFFDKSAVEETISNECWSKCTNFVDTLGNHIVRYRCNKVKARGVQCAAAVRLVYNSTNNEIYLYRSEAKHNHDEILTNSKQRLPEMVKEEIKNIFTNDSNVKPNKILQILSVKKMPIPTKTQLNNYLARLRKEMYSSSIMPLGELEKITIVKSEIPEDLS